MTPTQRKALEQALECLHDNRHHIITKERPAYLALYDKAIGDAEAALAEQPAEQEPPIAIVVDAYDTPGLQWLCQAPPSRGTRLFLQTASSMRTKKIHPLDVPLEVFLADLTTRPANVIRLEMRWLFDGEPLTVRHLCMIGRAEMKRWPNFGKKCLNEVEELLRARGLQLWENHDERSLRLLRAHKEYSQ